MMQKWNNRRSTTRLVFCLAVCLVAQAAQAQDVGRESGRPIPRFEAVRGGELNLRIGPALHYPVQKVIRRPGLPVLIEEETLDAWRRVLVPMDTAGTRYIRGWVSGRLLNQQRSVMVRAQEPQIMRLTAYADSRPVAEVEPGVIGRLRGCAEYWCQISIDHGLYEGWLPKTALWGVE